MVAMGPYNSAMGADLVKEVEQLQKDLASGKVHSFTGPIYDLYSFIFCFCFTIFN